MNHYFLIGFIAYLVLVNILSFAAMGLDKNRAEAIARFGSSRHNGKRKISRIPEALFFEFTGIGGGIGVVIAMFVFRHKVRNIWFLLGVPVVIVLQAILVACAYLAGAH